MGAAMFRTDFVTTRERADVEPRAMFSRSDRGGGDEVAPRRSRPRSFISCLICVACSSCLFWHTAARAEPSSPTAKITKGPYLQALASTSVEIRAELDTPAPASIKFNGGADAGAVRTVRDDDVIAMHVVRVSGLAPATHYTYAFAAGSTVVNGEFTTAPSADSTAPFSFLVYGDNRSDDAAHAAIVRGMLQSQADFIVNTGDMVQSGASDADWQSFFDVEGVLLRDHNVFACVGNHEITEGAGANYLRYFGPTFDAHGAGEKPKLYGSFRWGDTRFFLLDAMETFDSGPERAWLDDELARADSEQGLVWRIVVMHHAPWSAGPHGGNARALRAGIPALFAAHHVDLVIAGHDHIYERGFASGIHYLISGGGGAPLYEIKGKVPSTRKVESVHHLIEVVVQTDAIRIVAKRDDGSVLERCGMTKVRQTEQRQEAWDCDPPPTPQPTHNPPDGAPPAASSRWGCGVAGAKGSPEPTAALMLAAWGILGVRGRRRRQCG